MLIVTNRRMLQCIAYGQIRSTGHVTHPPSYVTIRIFAVLGGTRTVVD